MNIREFYLKNYPTDELGEELDQDATFAGLLDQLNTSKNVYTYIGIGDSLIRERLFRSLAEQLRKPYEYVYLLWSSNGE